jgi:hypothetical protein
VKRSFKKIALKELAGLVSSTLKKHGVEAVLTGGACVTIYSQNKYQSLDLDFVSSAVEYNAKNILAAMQELGFKRAAEGFFARKDCPYIVEFIPPPLAIGSEPVKKTTIVHTRGGSLRLLSPTDCVKDRLAAYYHWNDPQSLEQAVMVAKKHRIDLKEVKRWSKIEGKLDKYKTFLLRKSD